MSTLDCRERFFVKGAVRARALGIGPRGLVLRRRETTLAGRARLGDSAGSLIPGGLNEILQPSLDVEQLRQPVVVRFVH
jgi:hypothetical protein